MASNDSSALGTAYRSEAELPSVPVALAPIEKFREFLEMRGLKSTGERTRIVEHVFQRHNHFEADELVASMKSNNLSVSRSTVYRTLTLLVEAGLLRELQFGARTAFEHSYGYPRHEHLVCTRCGSVFEFLGDELEQLIERFARQFRFRPTNHKLIIEGICEKCNRPQVPHRKLDLI